VSHDSGGWVDEVYIKLLKNVFHAIEIYKISRKLNGYNEKKLLLL
jgi:hypothetical protein